MSSPNYTSLDALKYLARRITSVVDWSTESLGCNHEMYGDEHDEIRALDNMVEDMNELLGPLAERWGHYSDGREIETCVWIEDGHSFGKLWHPDPTHDKPDVFTGRRLADPGDDRGTYEITIRPPQSVTVELFPPKPVGGES